MALRTSPSVVFLEKDNSFFPPTIDSSIVGILGFASKGPTDAATLITSPQQLISTFGEPSENIPSQAIEGAIEILEATNKIYFVRAADDSAVNASAAVTIGSCPAVQISAASFGVNIPLTLKVQVTDNEGVSKYSTVKTFTITSGTATSSQGQAYAIQSLVGDGTIEDDKVGVFYDSTTTSTGYLVGSWAGSGTSMSVSAFSGTAGSTPVSVLQALDYNGSALTVASSVVAYGSTFFTSSLYYHVQSLYPGDGYNLGAKLNGQVSGNSVEVDAVAGKTVKFSVNQDGVQSELFKVSLVTSGDFVEDVINTSITNNTSELIKAELYFSGAAASPAALASFVAPVTSLGLTVIGLKDYTGTARNATGTKFPKFIEQTRGLASGDAGYDADDDTNATTLIGNSASKTGLYALDDDFLNISIACVPGVTNQSVQNALITLAETSQNFIALVSPPIGLATVQDAVDWMNGRGDGRTAAINSSWASVTWPEVQVFSTYDGKDRWYDPVIFKARAMAYTDSVAQPWFAAAGYRRGRLTKPSDVAVIINEGDQDVLYNSNVNPIRKFTPDGIVIFGQKTAQRLDSLLNRENVRRLMIYLRKTFIQVGKPYVFEPNDEFTWEQVKDVTETALNDIKAERGIREFTVICDETVNTPLRNARNELWCKVKIRPTTAAEIIVFEVNLTNQSTKIGA